MIPRSSFSSFSSSSANSINNSSSFWYTCGLLLLTTTTVASLAALWSSTKMTTKRQDDKNKNNNKKSISVAFLGNSMLYFNDCPRLVQNMLQAAKCFATVQQDSCLRGGATLSSLWQRGNGMTIKFATPPAAVRKPNGSLHYYNVGALSPQTLLSTGAARRGGGGGSGGASGNGCWDYVLVQDHTQSPARPATRNVSMETLTTKFWPLLMQQQQQQQGKSTMTTTTTTTILLLQTHAYRVAGIKESSDLGDFHHMTEQLASGYQAYAEALRNAGAQRVIIVPMGRAVQWLYVHRQHDLWPLLYSWDDFHPSPHGTWLQACLIFLAVTDGSPPPPVYNALWWDDCRYMQPPDEKPLPLPTADQAEELRQVAMMIHYKEQKRQQQQQSSSLSLSSQQQKQQESLTATRNKNVDDDIGNTSSSLLLGDPENPPEQSDSGYF